ncbi:membrane-associated oxidoreductase [Streptomyces sp. NPDC002817]|uniref:membrane-associated oxidoreductase n=1 Tax=Streptomyces sp. NPDC088357 TaxID=3154655 RepID=UPI0034384E5A
MEINDLTPAERRVWEAFATGTAVDFHDAGEPERTVRAVVLRALMLNGPRQEGEIPALRLNGAYITGALDLRHGAVDTSVRLSRCQFEESPRLYGSQIRQLNLRGSTLPGLDAGAVCMEGVLRLTDCRFRGPVRLSGARIAGALFMERAQFTSDTSDAVLQLNHAEIGRDLLCQGLTADGEVLLTGAAVGGLVNFHEAELRCPGGTALNAEALAAEADVVLRRVRTQGLLELRGARIRGRLILSRAHLSNPGGTALHATSCTIGELWLRKGPPVDGVVNLRRSQVELLDLEPDMVPGRIRFNSLTYTTLIPHEPAERRLPMLERDVDGYVPHAYEQLTAAYLRIGDDYAARQVQLAKQRRLRATRAWYGRLWGYLQDVTVGYGFRPLRACAWLVSLLAVGSLVYALHEPPPLKPGEHPDFDPVFFTLDLLLPVISFGQEGAFAPQGGYQALSYALVITGWILATTVVTGVTRAVSRQ